MGELAQRLDGIRVRVRAPRVDIEVELRNRAEFTLSFGESAYDFIDERGLESALAHLARLLYAGWQRQYLEAISYTSLNVEPNDQHDLNFRDECRAVESSGESGDSSVLIYAIGMDQFGARIRPGTVRELSEFEFSDRVAEAATRLLHDYQGQVAELKVRYYG